MAAGARIDERHLTVSAGESQWPFTLDLRTGTAVLEADGRIWRVRPQRWIEKRMLARFASCGEDFIRTQLWNLCVQPESSRDTGDLGEAVLGLAAWLSGGSRDDVALPLDSALLTRVTMTACRELGVSPGILDDLPVYEVESFWRQVPDGQFANARGRTDEADAFTHKILIVPDLQSSDAPPSPIGPSAPAEAPASIARADLGPSANPIVPSVPARPESRARVPSESERSLSDHATGGTGSPTLTETTQAPPAVIASMPPRSSLSAQTLSSSSSQVVPVPIAQTTSIAVAHTGLKPAAQAASSPTADAVSTPIVEASPSRADVTPSLAERVNDQPLAETTTISSPDARQSIAARPQSAAVGRAAATRRQPSVSRFRVVSGSTPETATPRPPTAVAFVPQPLTRAEPVDMTPLRVGEWPLSQPASPAGANMPAAFEPFAGRVGRVEPASAPPQGSAANIGGPSFEDFADQFSERLETAAAELGLLQER